MSKKLLLAAAALSVMAFAGAASAHTLAYRAGAGAGNTGTAGNIASGDVEAAAATSVLPYKLAVESTATTPTSAVFQLSATLSAGSNFPSGNNFIQIDLTNGTFATGLTSASVQAAGCTVVLSSGGGSGSTTARFLVSSAGAGCNVANIDLPVTPGSTGSTLVTTTLTTEAGSPIDPDSTNTSTAPNQEQLAIVTRPSAFNASINGVIGEGALDDTYATLTVTPVYTTFKVGAPGHTAVPETATVGQLGTVEVLVDTTAYRDLAKNLVVVGDVQSVQAVTAGNFSAFNGAGGAVELGGVAATFNTGATQATHTGAGLTTALVAAGPAGTPVSPEPFIVTRETAPVAIPASDYTMTLTYNLNPAAYIASETVQGSLERIGRDGTNVVFPWLNDTTVSASSGTTNRIRLGNIGSEATGPVYAEILNSSTNATTASPVVIAPNIPAGGEVRITTQSLTTALGAFGRGDVRISVEAPANTITARRYLQTANGGITELSNGTVASEQTPADPADVE